ncbi:MAG: FtsX-like permease family protein, partial [Verrucomicrobiota bacterium]
AMYLILFMIMIVGGFCIMNTMITVTFQKRSEIGLMKALGAREGQVAWVFLSQGILVGLVGVIVGLVMAQLTIYFRNDMAGWVGRNFGVDLFSAEVYKVDGGLPAEQTLSDLIIISSGAFIACILASLIPAVIAASLQPAKALRSE